MKDDQVTLRLPKELAQALADRAAEQGVPKSQLVREALQSYLAAAPATDPDASWRRVAHLVGALELDPAAVERDLLASQLRRHNWRE